MWVGGGRVVGVGRQAEGGFTLPLGQKPSVKADLAIYSHVVDTSGQCMSVSLMLRLNWISVLAPLGMVL